MYVYNMAGLQIIQNVLNVLLVCACRLDGDKSDCKDIDAVSEKQQYQKQKNENDTIVNPKRRHFKPIFYLKWTSDELLFDSQKVEMHQTKNSDLR
jgi:hypothetical protein